MFNSTEMKIYEKIKTWKKFGILNEDTLSMGTVFGSMLFAFLVIGALARIDDPELSRKYPNFNEFIRYGLVAFIVIIPIILHKFFSTRIQIKNRVIEKQFLRHKLQKSLARERAAAREIEAYKYLLDDVIRDAKTSAELFDEVVKENETHRELRRHTLAMIDRINYFQKKRSQSDGQDFPKNDSAS